MTTQKQLLEIAAKYFQDDPGVTALMLSIKEGQVAANVNLQLVKSMAENMQKGVEMNDGYVVMLDNTQIMTNMFKATAAMHRLAADFTNLAVVLELLGEKISY